MSMHRRPCFTSRLGTQDKTLLETMAELTFA
jgi:hypothetical protein